MARHEADVAIIGAGTAGLAAFRAARSAGAWALLIDPEFRGTTCAYAGCMPSKLLIAAGDAAAAVRGASTFGVNAVPQVDGKAVMARVQALRDEFAGGVRDNIAELPDEAKIRARAHFTGPNELALDNGNRVQARAIVIATGASPAVPSAFDAVKERVLTSETIFDMPDLPASLGVIGAGPLGLELAQALSRLGVAVTLFDAADKLAAMPPEATDVLKAAMGFPIHLGTTPKAEPCDAGVRLSWEGGEVEVSQLLVAAGRPPNLERLQLDTTGLELDDHGTPLFDPATMQCGEAAIFLAGDASVSRPVLHEASDEGTIAGHNAAVFPNIERSERKVQMAVTYTRPEAAQVGVIPEEDEAGIVTGRADYSTQGRARAMGQAAGLVHIHAEAKSGRLTGATICAPGGEHLAHLLAWAIADGKTASELLEKPFYHPTLEEGLQAALREICKASGTPQPWYGGDGDLPGA
ncbi:dihydrolipoyl dehydrogenase [Pseudoroseicyclus sp. H15]